MKKPASANPASFRLRTAWAFGLLIVAASALSARAVQLQLVDNAFLVKQGDARFMRVVSSPAHRGNVLDRNGEPLAVSTPVDSVWANPKLLSGASEDWPKLAKVLKRDRQEFTRRLTNSIDRDFIYLARHMSPQDAQAVRKLELPGVNLTREYRRYYPAGEVAGHVLGFTNIDDEGQEGTELAFDHWLAGEDGAKRVIQDRYGRKVQDVENIRSARPGRDLTLSIDLRIQYLAYRELKSAIRTQRARSGSVVVIDTLTGEVLAMVNQPTYNPNDREQINAGLYRNRAATDIVEPGSSIKPFIVAAALQSGRYDASSIVDTSPGLIRVGAKLIEDEHPIGAAGLGTILAKSSNVGMTKIALTLEPKQIWTTMTQLGFGRVTTSGFPGESAGLLTHYANWRPIGIASMSYGYGLSVTPLQLAHAYATVGALGVNRPVSMLRGRQPRAGRARAERTYGEDAHHTARVGRLARRHRQAGGHRRLSRGRQDRHRAEGERRRLQHVELRRRIRRRRPGHASATRRRRRHRRAGGGQVLRRRRRGAGVLGGRRGCIAPARRRAGSTGIRQGRCADRCARLGTTMRLDALVYQADLGDGSRLSGRFDGSAELSGLTLDSREVRPGAAFLACRGERTHGLAFLDTALAQGAAAVLWEPAEGVAPPTLPHGVASVPVPQLAARASAIAACFFGDPSSRLRVIGITGTNGKTTCAWLLAQALEQAGHPAAYIGTIGSGRLGAIEADAHTTPDAVTLQRLLAELHRDGATHVAIEVSSHALVQGRASAVRFAAAVFTNLTHDHLDYHGTFERYGEAKALLFSREEVAVRVINADDAFGATLLARYPDAIGFSASGRRGDDGRAWLRATEVVLEGDGLRFTVESSFGSANIATPLIGDFNLANALTVLGVLLGLGLDLGTAAAAMQSLVPPPGRMERFGGGASAPLVAVDYAHTPDALEKALQALRQHTRGRLWCVFGCGGDRDRAKRPVMGAIAARLADEVVVTDDNPRGESPATIVRDILAGIDAAPVRVEHDRATAIAFAVLAATSRRCGAGRRQGSRVCASRRRRAASVQRCRGGTRRTRAEGGMKTLAELARIAGGRLQGDDRAWSALVTDTRNLKAGEVYLALRGPRFDGNDFVAAAAAAGATGAVVDRLVDVPGLPLIVVDDGQQALTRAGYAWRRAFAGTVVAVAGSNGKTTTKELTAAILAQRGPVLATRGNLNNHIGVPLTLLRLAAERSAVIEIGANGPGEMAALVEQVAPDVALITNAGAEHLEGFGDLDGVARAEGELVAKLPASAVAVLNADDPYFDLWRGMTRARVASFGTIEGADYRATDIHEELGDDGFTLRFTLTTPQGTASVQLGLGGRHNVVNACGAAAAAIGAGASLAEVVAGLAGVRPVPGRLQPRRTRHGARLIDDSYNANPSSMRAGIDVLVGLGGAPWLVIGDMGELGTHAESSHTDIGRYARERGVTRLFATGRLSTHAVEAFGAGASWYPDTDSLARALDAELGPQVTTLVKGSRSNRLERVVGALLAETH